MKSLLLIDTVDVTDCICEVYSPSYATQFIPSVYNRVSQGKFYFKTPGLAVRRIVQPSIITGFSDVIQVGQHCLFEKLGRFTANKITVFDSNFAGFNNDTNTLNIRDFPVIGGLSKAYSMLGALSFHWGHFIAEYFPSFVAALNCLDEDVVLVVPEELDSVQRSLIAAALSFYGRKNKVFFCPKRTSILVDILYVADRSAFISDHAEWLSIYDNIVQDFNHKEVRKIRNSFRASTSKFTLSRPKKIFLTRNSQTRKVFDIEKVEEFFRLNGYSVVEPTTLSHAARVDYFAECEELIGIYSSAFYNLIYCQSIKSVKIFAPFCRCYDQIYQNIFRPDFFSYFVTDAPGDGIHPDLRISQNDCEQICL